ncbi:class I SAM-dependent methyltransferase [Microlunatus elymi]|uniref:Class I SAM-dependent methyltransferase n=1 Tax=Microlunatus elymi TaxID=2596828 RepID=A0A516PUA7_9ACTN|nr:class I SAM-dependent methyltransferase [Microlunatus elymi]QDP94551.1 class I SAM-dependent methyltransferase [Microlunatus elymi]
MAPDALSTADSQQRRYWDDHATTYDRGMGFAERRILRDTRGWVCQQATGNTLEVAIGTGLNLPWYPKSIKLTGLDLSPRMLQLAKRRADELDLAVELKEGTASELPFDDSTFDTVVSTLSLCSIPDDKQAVSEMIRVLKPGGKLILADHVESSSAILRLLQRGVELWSLRQGEHFTRRPIHHLYAAGVHIQDHERFLAGMIEREVAIKPAW